MLPPRRKMPTPLPLIGLVFAVALAPPSSQELRTAREQLTAVDVEIGGRDPFAGTGLCGALLPVHGPDDVEYLSFPHAGFDLEHLRLLRHFPNLKQVRCDRAISESEYQVLYESVASGALILCRVKSPDGSVLQKYTRRSRGVLVEEPDSDVNGDGVIDENDLL